MFPHHKSMKRLIAVWLWNRYVILEFSWDRLEIFMKYPKGMIAFFLSIYKYPYPDKVVYLAKIPPFLFHLLENAVEIFRTAVDFRSDPFLSQKINYIIYDYPCLMDSFFPFFIYLVLYRLIIHRIK